MSLRGFNRSNPKKERRGSAIMFDLGCLKTVIEIFKPAFSWFSFKYKLTPEERVFFLENRDMVSKGLAFVYINGTVDLKTIQLFNQAKDHAELHLPIEIFKFIEDISKKALQLFECDEELYGANPLPVGSERSKIAKLQGELVLELAKNKYKKVNKLYRKYIINDGVFNKEETNA